MLVSQVLKLKVNISYQQAISFRETQRQFIAACNLVSQYIFDHGFILQQRTLQDRLYRKIRADYDMPSFLAQSVIKTVIAKYKTVKTLDIDRLAKKAKKQGWEFDPKPSSSICKNRSPFMRHSSSMPASFPIAYCLMAQYPCSRFRGVRKLRLIGRSGISTSSTMEDGNSALLRSMKGAESGIFISPCRKTLRNSRKSMSLMSSALTAACARSSRRLTSRSIFTLNPVSRLPADAGISTNFVGSSRRRTPSLPNTGSVP